MLGFGTTEIIILVVILIMLFGAKKVPEIAKGVGQGIRQVRGIFKEEDPNSQNKDPKDNS